MVSLEGRAHGCEIYSRERIEVAILARGVRELYIDRPTDRPASFERRMRGIEQERAS